MPISTIGAGSAGDAGLDLLFGTTLTVDTATVTTGTLPTGYRGLVIDLRTKTDEASTFSTLRWIYNGDDNNSNYIQALDFAGSVNGGAVGVSAKYGLGNSIGNNAGSANFFSTVRAWIPDHESTTGFKSGSSVQNLIADTSNLRTYRWSNVWLNTAAITTITFVPDNSSPVQTKFLVGSSFSVYGVK